MNVIALAMLEAKSTTPSQYVQDMVKVANEPGTTVTDFKSGAAAVAAGTAINYSDESGPIVGKIIV